MYIIAEKTSYKLSVFKTGNFHKALSRVMDFLKDKFRKDAVCIVEMLL